MSSTTLYNTLHLFVFLALRPGVTGGQSSIGFMADRSKGSLRTVTPNTNLSITCFWDTQEFVNVSGVVDTSTTLVPQSVSQANGSARGSVVFIIQGFSLSLGEHTVNFTARSLTPVTVTKIINATVPVKTGTNSMVTTVTSLSDTEETSESAPVTTVGASTSKPTATTDTDQAGITVSTVILTDESPAKMAATTISASDETSVIISSSEKPSVEIKVTEENVTETVMYPIEETIYVTVYNEEPVTGLRLDHSNSFYDIVNDTTKLTASVATGSALSAQWVFGDEVNIREVQENISTLGFTYPHVWKYPGTFIVYLNVSNRVSASYTQANVTVSHPFDGLNFSTSGTILETLEEMVLTLSMVLDTKVHMGRTTFNLTWGDGAGEFDVLNLTTGQSLALRHTYSVQGDRCGSLELASPLGNNVFTFAVKVWDKLNVTLDISPAASKPGDNFTLTFVNPPKAGFQYFITWSGGSLFSNNQSALYANFSHPTPPYTVSFEKEGVHVINLHALNPLYSYNTSYTVIVEVPVTGLTIAHGNNFYDSVNDTTKCTASVATGTALTAQWLFGNEVYVHQVPDNISTLGFTYPHVWKYPGTYIVYLNVSNQVSAKITQANVTVIHPLNGFNFFTSDNILETLEELVLTLSMASNTKEPMGNVTFNLTWGDGVGEFNVLNVIAGQTIVYRHIYDVQGNKSGCLELVSPVEIKVFTFTVKVWDKLNVTLNISPAAAKPGDNFTLTFVNPPKAGFQYFITWRSGVLFSNDQSALYANFSPPDPPYTVFFEKEGVYDINLHALNLIYSFNTSYTISVEVPVTGLTIAHGNSFYDIVNDTTKLTASVATGTALTAQWTFGSEVYVHQVHDNASTLGFTYPHVWKYPGTFIVYLNVSNQVSANITQANVTVIHPLNGFNFFTSDTILQTQEELVLTLSMASNTKEPMGNVTFNLTWGDGAGEFNVLNVTPGQNRVFRHTYSVQGDRGGSLELVSPVGIEVFTFSVKVWDKLSVTLDISPAAGQPNDNFTLTFVNPPKEGFQYVITCPGSHVFSNDQSALYANFSPPEPPYTVSLNSVGEYAITLYAFNLLYSFNTSYTIYVQIPVTGLSIVHSNRFYDIVNDTTKFTASVATGTALTAQWVFDNEVYVQQVPDNASTLGFSYPHVWKNPGTFIVHLNVYNRVSANITQTNITVIYPLNGLTFSASDTILQTLEELVLTLTMASDTKVPMGNVTFNLTWGDGAGEFNVLNIIAGKNLIFRHTYDIQGGKNGSLELVSPLENKVFTFVLEVWDKLNVTLEISPAAGRRNQNFILTFANPPKAGFQYVITCMGSPLFSNNQSALYADYSPPNSPYSVSFTTEGEYAVTLYAFNLMYSYNTSYTIYVDIPIAGLSIVHSNRFYDIVNDTTKLTASVATATWLTAQWVFGSEVYVQKVSKSNSMSGFTSPHVWKYPGTFSVYVQVSNRLSASNTQANVTVIYPLNGFNFSASNTILQTLEELVLTLSMASDTKVPMGNVTFNLTWGDGAGEFGVLNVTAGKSLVFKHAYGVQGDRSGSLRLISAVEIKVFTFTAKIWDKLKVTLNISPAAGKPGDNFTLTFVNPPNAGFQYVITCSGVNMFSNNQSALYANFLPPNPRYIIHLENLGVYAVELMAFNLMYSFNTNYTIIIENPLRPEDLIIFPARVIIPIPEKITFTSNTLNRSYFTTAFCTWDFGHNGTTSPVYVHLPGDLPADMMSSFDSEGTFLVSFYCWNNISEATVISNVTARNWNLGNFMLTYENVQVMNGYVPRAAVLFSLSLLDIQFPPSRLKARFDFGDGSLPNTIALQNWTYLHMYPYRNVYNGTLILSHPDKGNLSLSLKMRVGAFQLAVESFGGLVMSDTFRFNVSVPMNFSGFATVDFGDGSFTSEYKKVDTVWIFSHVYQRVGYYQASLTGGYNSIRFGIPSSFTDLTKLTGFTENVSFQGTLEVEGSVQYIKLIVLPNEVLHPPGKVTAYVRLDSPHRIMHMNCSLNWDEIMDETFISLTGPMEPYAEVVYQYTYITLGSKVVTLECRNAYSHNIVQVEVFVNNECFSPDPIFDRQYSKLAKPMTVLNSDQAKLVTRTVIICTDIKPSFTWAIKFARNGSVLTFEYPDLDYLTWERGQLEPNLYRFSLNISFGREHDFCWLSEMIYVRVERAPLVVDIQGGKVRKTGDPHAIVDARTGSYDRVMGYGNNEGLAFTWSCKAYNSNSVQELLSLAPAGSSVLCDSLSTEIEAGKRQLNIPDSVKALGLLFEVVVSYDDSTSNATAYVQFIRGSLNAEINCIVNCGMKVAVSSKLVLNVTCDRCIQVGVAAVQYQWKVFKVVNSTSGTKVEISDTNIFEKTDTSSGRGAVIKEDALEGCQTYRVEVNVTLLADHSNGFAAREFRTNCPPWGGNCTVTPLQGNVMTDSFSMWCAGWKDEGFSDDANSTNEGDEKSLLLAPLIYKFLLRRNDTVFPIAQGGESKMPRGMLPIFSGANDSEYELVARIFDPWNDFVEVSHPINLYFDDSNASLQTTLAFWDGQASYTNWSSNLEKKMKSLTIASSLISTYNASDNQTQLQAAQESSSGNTNNVVNAEWNDIWTELQNPSSTPIKDNLTAFTDKFINMVRYRGEDAKNLSGHGLTALAEGLSMILLNPATTSSDSVTATVELIEMATEALRNLYTKKPYPIIENLKESVSAMTALLDRLVAASVPSYDIAVGSGIVFNSSDISEDDKIFIQESLGIVSAVKDQQKIDLIKKVLPKLEETLHAMYDSLLTGMVVDQVPEMIERGGISLMASKMTGHALTTSTIVADPKTVLLEIKSGGDTASDRHTVVDVKATVYIQNPYAWSSDSSSYNITSPVVRVDLRDNNGTRALSTLSMTIKRGAKVPLPSLGSFLSNDTRGGFDNLLYHRLSVPSLDSTVVTYIQLPLEMGNVVAYFRSGNPPALNRYDFTVEGKLILSTESELALSSDENTTTFKFVVPPGVLKVGRALVGFYIAEGNETFAYKYLSFTDSCHVWDNKNLKWVPACEMSSASTAAETVCTCKNPPGVAFASAFMVPPNTIDFTLVFYKFDPSNASVYGTLIGLLLVWVLGVVWARRQDKKDKEKWLVGYLKDNLVGESYLYLLTVHTGLKRGSGTKSNISFVLGGSQADSGIRVLSDGKRSLETGSVMRYIMATGSCLGHLDYVRIWHDNSGGYQAGWFLNRIDVENLHTGQRYLFICERWLAVDKDNGVVDRLVPLAQQDEIMSFDKLFSEYTKIGITDTHLWLSCFLRPAPSTFTRVQRVSCCLVLLLLTMITSAMFYKTEDRVTGTSSNSVGMEVKVGFLRFSLTTLWTSSVSIVITSVPMMIFVLIFRNYRPLSGPRAKKQQKGKVTELTDVCKTPEPKENTCTSDESLKDSVGINLQTNLLPHYWRYIGWLLLMATAATCAFFLVLYSMQWGITTSEEWLASFVTSFFESIFLMDPIKVILLACLLAYCVHNPYTDQSDIEDVSLKRVQVEVSMFSARAIDPAALPPDPVPRKVLAQSRKRRLHEQESQRVFFDLLLYIFFVFCVYSLSYGNRDDNTFSLNDHLDNLLFQTSGDAPFPFQSITRREEVIRWMKETMLPVLFPRRDSLGNSLQLRERVFTSDPTSFRVGPVRVRQLRMPLMERTSIVGGYSSLLGNPRHCPPYSMGQEERGMYCVGWKPLASCSYEEQKTKVSRAAWMYQSFEGLSSLPVWGTYSVYSSGGYVMDFSINWDVILLTLQELEEKIWLDKQTRAIFLEFSLYNPDSNLFSYLRLSAEFPETGDAFLGRKVQTFRIYEHLQAVGLYMYICEIIAAIGVIIFTIKIALKIKQQQLGFFHDFWQVLDLSIVMICYVTVAFYAIKTMKVNESMAAWRDNPKQYVDFYQTAFWDDMYGYSLAAIVFITTIRLLRILGYNRRLTMIAAVLANSGRDLFGLSLVFAVVFMAYLSAGYLVFASTLSEFRSPWESVFALYQMLLGRNVLAVFSDELALFAWVYFISYVILVFMILMTMFQAIVCGSSTIVRSEVSSVPPPYGLTNLFVKFYHTVIAELVPAWLTRGKGATGPAEAHAQSAGSTHPPGDKTRKHPSTKKDHPFRRQTYESY